MNVIKTLLSEEGVVTAFATVGIIMYLANLAAKYLTGGRIHGSAIAIVTGIARVSTPVGASPMVITASAMFPCSADFC